jgi:carboxyl-terminal processing protease
LLAHQHFREQPINDALSAQVLDTYLDALDPDRYYFTQRDVDEFHRHERELDDMLLDGDLELPYRIFDRLSQRAVDRAEYAKNLLDQGLDFSADQALNLDRSEQE